MLSKRRYFNFYLKVQQKYPGLYPGSIPGYYPGSIENIF